ncbi:hypothetical protein F4680DRAFT_447597 [Xylaria scruposa]|nr:hypothetical protein F4680DRAFT_447597 [Xylaria scruposa]
MQRTSESILPRGVAQSSRSMLPAGKVTACYRCHERKVKCSGDRPCQNCQQSNKADECSYPLRNRTIKVRQSFLDGLFQEIDRLKQQSLAHPHSGDSHATENDDIDNTDSPPEVTQQSPPFTRPETSVDAAGDETDTSPAISTGPWFDSLNVFKSPVLIGEAADAAFVTRFRQVITDPAAPKPNHLLRLNYASDESLMSLIDASTPWPGPSRAKFLLEAAMKYIGRCYHIVQRQVAFDGWEQISRDPSRGVPILRFRYWALFAIGELYIAKSIGGGGFPGLAYFAQASKALGYLDERPEVESVELYLLLSFYSTALNRRYSAYLFAGTAMRTAIVIGLHLNIPGPQLPDAKLHEHRKRLFWTVYIIDRLCASNLNLPPAIQDDEIGIDLPSDVSISAPTEDDGDAYYNVANIKLAGLLTAVIRSVYRVQNQAEGTCANLSSRVQVCLKNLQTWFGNLPARLQIDDNSIDEPHDLKVVSLHLRFYQCVILATRPLLLHALRIQIAASRSDASTPSLKIPPSATALSQACIRCAHQSMRLLKRAWIDGTFVTFDCFFTQHLFSSLTILAISSVLDGVGSRHDRDSYEEASRLLDQLKMAGNMVAQECYHHVEVMESALLAHMKVNLPSQPDAAGGSSTIAGGSFATADMPWPEPSLQQLLSQSALDLHFLEAAYKHVRPKVSRPSARWTPPAPPPPGPGFYSLSILPTRNTCRYFLYLRPFLMFLLPHNLGWEAALSPVSRATKCDFHWAKVTYCTQPKLASTTRSQPILRLMPLGGSVTHGVGSFDQNGYRKALLELLHGCGFNVCMVGSRKAGTFSNNEHEGWRGFRIDQIETKAKISAGKLLPHIFTVNAGSNDCLQGYRLAEASKRLRDLLKTLWRVSPGSTVVLSSLLVNRDEAIDLRVRNFNKQAEEMSQIKASEGKKVVFVDMHGDDGPSVEDLVDDGTHPNDAGYTKMANIWLRGIQSVSNGGYLCRAR